MAEPWPHTEVKSVGRAINHLKMGKAVGISEVNAEMLKASGDNGVGLVMNLINAIVYECTVPNDWLKSVTEHL